MKEVLTYKQVLQIIETNKQRVLDEISYCMLYPNCNELAINSHVFQRKLILSPIATGSELYQFNYNNFFYDQKINYQRKGTKEVLAFKGFCKSHDNDIFKPIEPINGIVDWSSKESQFLLGYRSLCRELYVNIVMKRIITLTNNDIYIGIEWHNKNMQKIGSICSTIVELIHYKKLLEVGILEKNYSNYNFETITLPFQLDLCLSAPVFIADPRGHNYNYDNKEMNIINIFPYKGETVIIFGYCDDYENIWYKQMSEKIKSKDPLQISEAFQDTVFRAEFHGMSKKLYDSISIDIQSFLNEWIENMDNYGQNLDVKSNIFYNSICNLMK